MPESSWRENDSYNELESLGAFLSDLSDQAEPERPERLLKQSGDGRRRKAAAVLVVIWSGTIALHLLSWGYWVVLGVATLMGLHAMRILLARPLVLPDPLPLDDPEQLPFVSLLVAAKNEEAVIGRLVKLLCSLDYPANRYELWVINDNSTDQTAPLLDHLAKQYQQLHVLHREPGAGGGKSGALNQAISLAQGDIVAVFDADAQVSPDLLRRVLPLFQHSRVGAVQVRKAILCDARHPNLLIQGQVAEMALDTFIHQQRAALGGIGELRGNGQFVRRTALDDCGGWNEETITDDLDLTLRLHLNNWKIEVAAFPAVEEEGVTRAIALWHQRNRWAEGGYQRYLDYWRPLLRNRLRTGKSFDLLAFWITQYFLPTAALPDAMMAIVRNRPLLYSPIAGLAIALSMISMFSGLRQIQAGKTIEETRSPARMHRLLSALSTLMQTLWGTLYMFHWLPVVASTTIRMSLRPKRLKWVKTVHHGSGDLWLDVTEQAE